MEVPEYESNKTRLDGRHFRRLEHRRPTYLFPDFHRGAVQLAHWISRPPFNIRLHRRRHSHLLWRQTH